MHSRPTRGPRRGVWILELCSRHNFEESITLISRCGPRITCCLGELQSPSYQVPRGPPPRPDSKTRCRLATAWFIRRVSTVLYCMVILRDHSRQSPLELLDNVAHIFTKNFPHKQVWSLLQTLEIDWCHIMCTYSWSKVPTRGEWYMLLVHHMVWIITNQKHLTLVSILDFDWQWIWSVVSVRMILS